MQRRGSTCLDSRAAGEEASYAAVSVGSWVYSRATGVEVACSTAVSCRRCSLTSLESLFNSRPAGQHLPSGQVNMVASTGLRCMCCSLPVMLASCVPCEHRNTCGTGLQMRAGLGRRPGTLPIQACREGQCSCHMRPGCSHRHGASLLVSNAGGLPMERCVAAAAAAVAAGLGSPPCRRRSWPGGTPSRAAIWRRSWPT